MRYYSELPQSLVYYSLVILLLLELHYVNIRLYLYGFEIILYRFLSLHMDLVT